MAISRAGALEGGIGEDRILTVPNLITLARLCCVPVFVWLLFGVQNRWAAVGVLGATAATDWLDGWFARRYGQVSNLGKVLDPVADRVLVVVAVVSILVAGAAPVWLGVLVLVREAVVSLATMVLAAMGAARIDVVWAGKAGTFALMFAFPLFLAGHSGVSWQEVPEVAAWVFALPGLALGWYAAASYLPLARTALAEGRLGSEA